MNILFKKLVEGTSCKAKLVILSFRKIDYFFQKLMFRRGIIFPNVSEFLFGLFSFRLRLEFDLVACKLLNEWLGLNIRYFVVEVVDSLFFLVLTSFLHVDLGLLVKEILSRELTVFIIADEHFFLQMSNFAFVCNI